MNARRGSVEAIVIAVLAVGLIATLGYVFWQNSSKKVSPDPATTAKTNTDAPVRTEEPTPSAATKTYAPVIPNGWKTHESDDKTMSFAIPAGEKIEYQAYNTSEAIHVGYGAPVYVKYSTSDGWQTYENDSNNQPTVKRSENLVKNITVKAADKYAAAYYQTGDGTTSESRVLVVVEQKVYQFVFPGKVQTPELLTQFVKTLTFE